MDKYLMIILSCLSVACGHSSKKDFEYDSNKRTYTEENGYYDGVYIPVYEVQSAVDEEGMVEEESYIDYEDFLEFYEKHKQIKKEYEQLKQRFDVLMAEYNEMVDRYEK